MTREQAKSFLANDLGIENPTSSQVTAYLNKVNEENKNYALQRVQEEQEKYKDYVKPEDHQKVLDEVTSLKDANTKNERINKYKKANIDEAFLDYVDSKFKDSKDFDKDLEEFTKANPKFLTTTQSSNPKQQQSGAKFKGAEGGSAPSNPEKGAKSAWNETFRKAFGYGNN